MNPINLLILALFGLSLLFGLYKGFLPTLANTVGLFLSLAIAYFCYSLVSSWIALHKDWLEWVIYLSEGASHIPFQYLEYARSDVALLAAGDVAKIVEAAGFAAPFDGYILSNVVSRIYAPDLTLLRDYFNQTIADSSLNIIAFLLCGGVAYLISTLLAIFIDSTVRFPKLRLLDWLLGAGIALLRGYVILLALFMLVPLVLNMLQIEFLSQMMADSSMAQWFLEGNPFFGWITPYL
ncbi:MAG: CvpA family protein [Christensenellaceae bacterium]|nr:CvpA family protein [Christensenellaceae bacterium]